LTSASTPVTAQQRRLAELNSPTRKQRSLWVDAWNRLRRNKAAMVGLGVVALACAAALAADWIAPYDPLLQNTAINLREPIWGSAQYRDPSHLLGTDQLGRDILSRLLYSSRISMVIGFVPAAVVFVIGVTIGMIAGYAGGRTDNILMRLTDAIYAFPDLLFLIIIMTSLRDTAVGQIVGGLLLMFLAIAVLNWIGVARLTRGQVLSLKEREFVEAARAIGASPARIMLRHLFPNALSPLIVQTAFAVPTYILYEAGLSFLGVGIRPPTPTWGSMLNEGFVVFSAMPWLVLLPAFCISIVMLAFTFIGDGLRDALDPRMKL
jgi:oligopeptide transport system permease protein